MDYGWMGELGGWWMDWKIGRKMDGLENWAENRLIGEFGG